MGPVQDTATRHPGVSVRSSIEYPISNTECPTDQGHRAAVSGLMTPFVSEAPSVPNPWKLEIPCWILDIEFFARRHTNRLSSRRTVRPHRRHTAAMALAALALFLLAGPTPARIFQRWRAADAPGAVLEAAGGKGAYHADVHINGGKGALSVFSFEDDVRDVCEALYDSFKAEALRNPTGTLVLAKMESGDPHLTLVVLSTGFGQPTLVFSIAQTAAQARQSRTPPRNPLPELGTFPGAATVFYARDEEARTGMAVFESDAAPETLEAHYDAHLSARGWLAPLPLKGSQQLRLYQRKGAVCLVFAVRGPGGGPSRITLLHKELGIE